MGAHFRENLTPRQQRFVDEYLIDLNATQAAKRAGYSANNADKIGPALLGKNRVSMAIKKAQTEQQQRTQINADYVLQSLKVVADRCLQAEPVCDAEGLPTGEYKFNATGATRALELLGKHLGVFNPFELQKVANDNLLNETIKSENARRIHVEFVKAN
ncbi:MAG: terminase small subunit [Pseudomonadota bacterium]